MTPAQRGSAAVLLVSVAMMLVVVDVCEAGYTVYTDRGEFQAASGPLATEGFNTQHAEAQEVDFGPFSVRVEWQEVKWANAASFPAVVSEGAGSIYGFDTQPTSIGNGMAFTFDAPIRMLGIDIVDLSSGIYAQVPGVFIETLTDPGDTASPRFFGVINDEAFNHIMFHWGNNQDAVGLDYLQYAVPEPASLLLIGLGGLLTHAMFGRLRKQ